MRIALVHHHVGGKAGGGGGVRLMLELGLALRNRGHRVTIACHDYLPGGAFAYAAEHLDIRSVRHGISELPASRAALARRFWLDMPKVARLVPSDADVINSHEWLALRPGRIAARRLSAPLVWTRNDESLWERATVPEQTIFGSTNVGQRLLRAAVSWPDLLDARQADAIVVLSKPQVEMVRRSYRRDAVTAPVGPPPYFFEPRDREAARARLDIPDDVFLVMGAGILVPHRRFEDLLEALALIDDPSIRALIVGSDHVDPSYADRLSDQISRLGLDDRVQLPRRSVTDREMHDAYAAADTFAILSQRYAWGLAPLEAIAVGTPVIITRGAGVHDVLAGRPGVDVVPPEDARALSDAIVRARSDPNRESLGATRTWLREELAFERYVDRMEAIYSSVQRPSADTSRATAPSERDL